MKRRSFFFNLFLGNLLIVAVIIAFGGYVISLQLEDYHQQSEREIQQRLTDLSQEYLESLWLRWGNEPARLEAFAKKALQPALGVHRLTVIGRDGKVLADTSETPAAVMENHKTTDRPEVMGALEQGRGTWDRRSSETHGIEYQYYAKPIRQNGEIVAVIRIAKPLRALSESKGFIGRSLLIGAGAAAFAAIVLGFWTSWLWYTPLRQITRAAESIAAGRLEGRVHVGGSKELAQLAAALNDMKRNLSTQIDVIEEQRANLNTVLGNLQEGVLAMDRDDSVVYINDAAVDLLGLGSREDATGRHIQKVLRNVQIAELYMKVREVGEPARRQVELAREGPRRRIHAIVSPVEGKSQTITCLLLMQDITEVAQAAAIKSEFIANASHELRTPLATLRAAVDSVLTLAPEEYGSMPDLAVMLDRHVSRLENLTADLLDFHAVEQAGVNLKLADVHLSEIASWIQQQYTDKAGQHGVELDLSVTPEDAAVRSSMRLLELILQNLLDNAMKFTPSGGRVCCTIDLDEDYLTMRVSDTGPGIKPKDQPRVFERFFQAESSRTGDSRIRGTGLGLAIVKHAVERLEGSVSLDSKVGIGTTVTVNIPVPRDKVE